MERKKVKSTNLASIGYDPSNKILEVEFRGSGSIYQYHGVPQDIYDKLENASSIGKFFNKEIKDKFRDEEID